MPLRHLQIGPVHYSCDCTEEQFATIFTPDFGPFWLPSNSVASVAVKVEQVNGEAALPYEPGKVVVRATKGIVEIHSGTQHTTLDMNHPSITIKMGAVGSLFMPLRMCSALLFPSHRYLMLHSAAVVRDGQAYLFSGESGAGKTTISTLSQALGYTILTDDTTALGLTEDDPHAWGTPFSGTGNFALNHSAPVRGLFFLTQARSNRLTPMPRPTAVQRLMKNTMLDMSNFAIDSSEAIVNAILDTCLALTSRLPVYSLEFRPDQELWSILP